MEVAQIAYPGTLCSEHFQADSPGVAKKRSSEYQQLPPPGNTQSSQQQVSRVLNLCQPRQRGSKSEQQPKGNSADDQSIFQSLRKYVSSAAASLTIGPTADDWDRASKWKKDNPLPMSSVAPPSSPHEPEFPWGLQASLRKYLKPQYR